MPYLIKTDLYRLIQPDALAQITSGYDARITESFRAAEELCKSLLRQRYDVDAEFTETVQYDKTKSYGINQRVYIDAPLFREDTAYVLNDMVNYGGKIWRLNVATFDPSPWAPTGWVLFGNQYDIFYTISTGFPPFDYKKVYAVGDQVMWKGIQYTALQPTRAISHEGAIQYNNVSSIPTANVFPDDPNKGAAYWQNSGTFVVTAGTFPDNTAYWKAGDNRDEQMKAAVSNYALYDLHMRIAPKNVPLERMQRAIGIEADRLATKDGIIYPLYSALGYIQACAMGAATPSLPPIQPSQGVRIAFGGVPKNVNRY